jgi:16S rRNA (guanine527-N7)-methyltransferase
MSSSDPTLASVLAAHAIELPSEQVERLDRYCRLVWEWNEKLNLTRHTDYEKFVARDLVDTLVFSRFLASGERVLDVGTGGGVPGVVLGIVRPDVPVELCESVGKRARVVGEIVRQLGLSIPMHESRAENLLERVRFNTLIIRAVARLDKLLGWFRPHWTRFDRMLVLKGPAWVDERAEARHLGLLGNLALRKLHAYPLAGTESESVLLQICPKNRLAEDDRCPLSDLK